MSIMLLAFAIGAVPSTGSPSPVEARTLSRVFHVCAERLPRDAGIDAPLLAAVAWRESGFRPNAIREPKDPTKPKMLGLMQLNERFLPMRLEASGEWRNPVANVGEFCAKLKRLFRHHRDHCLNDDHHLIAHHFSGFRVTDKARKAALEVLRRRDELIALAQSYPSAA